MCFACRLAGQRLRLPLAPVLPVSLCPLPGPLYSMLLAYKEAALDGVRERAGVVVRQLLCDFVARHEQCLAGLLRGPVSVVVPVPSTVRPGPAPLDRIGVGAGLVDALGGGGGAPAMWCPGGLTRRARVPLRHMAAHPDAFEVGEGTARLMAGARVLLVDDTYVSGARAQSAAAALRRGGAARVAIVAVGRVIRPTAVAGHATLLERSRGQGATPGGLDCCARCVVVRLGCSWMPKRWSSPARAGSSARR